MWVSVAGATGLLLVAVTLLKAFAAVGQRSSTKTLPVGCTLSPYCVVPAKLSFSTIRCWTPVGPSHLTFASIVMLGGLRLGLLGILMIPVTPSNSAAVSPP